MNHLRRGGRPEAEITHGRELLASGAEGIWGWSTPAGQRRVEARIRWITESCGLRKGIRVLECGCGTGIFTRRLCETGAHITATDISADLLREARKTCVADNVAFIQTNLEDPKELPENTFDVMCGISVLHHLVLPQALLALKGKLKDRGLFAFSEPNLLNPINKYIIFTPDVERRRKLGVSPSEMAFYPKELTALFEEAGFVVHRLEHRDFLHPRIPRRLIPFIEAVQSVAENLPLIRRLSGSLWICGAKGKGGT